jgi:hypothetical protein
MRRSEVNAAIDDALAFLAGMRVPLPPWAYWSPAEWETGGLDTAELTARGLGWDITDFDSGRFSSVGLLLFTLRNWGFSGEAGSYGEKLLLIDEGQLTPYHFHRSKQEDIINRGGGTLAFQAHWSGPTEELADDEIRIMINSIPRRVVAGETVRLEPGEYVTLPPKLYHRFWAEERRVLGGEVSSFNDDTADNRFFEPLSRYPVIEEDEPARYRLVADYLSAR